MKYAAFLRGTNVGGKTLTKTKRLRDVFADAGKPIDEIFAK